MQKKTLLVTVEANHFYGCQRGCKGANLPEDTPARFVRQVCIFIGTTVVFEVLKGMECEAAGAAGVLVFVSFKNILIMQCAKLFDLFLNIAPTLN